VSARDLQSAKLRALSSRS